METCKFLFRYCRGGRTMLFAVFVTSAAYELLSFRVMSLLSSFYSAIVVLDQARFCSALYEAAFVVLAISFLKATRDYASDCCALTWRESMVQVMHEHYFLCGQTMATVVDNVDQRICQDADKLSTSTATLVKKMIVLPAVIIYYTFFLWWILGWMPPTFCYIYFAFGSVACSFIARKIVAIIYQLELKEGDFRFGHAQCRVFMHSITLLR